MRELGFPAKWKLSPAEKNNTPPYLKFRDEPERAFGKNEIFDIPEWESLDDSQKKFQAQKMEIHAAMVDRMDAEIGRIITKLKEMDALDNTVIMFFSDNGAKRGNYDPRRQTQCLRTDGRKRLLPLPRPRLGERL